MFKTVMTPMHRQGITIHLYYIVCMLCPERTESTKLGAWTHIRVTRTMQIITCRESM